MNTMERFLSLLVLSLVLTACGGGGGSTATAAAPATSGIAMPTSVGVVD